MKQILILGLIGIVSLTMFGCAEKGKIVREVPPQPGEKLLWQSHKARPDWINTTPEIAGGNLLFVGVSGMFSLEQDARENAFRDSIKYIIRYIGTFAKDEFQRLLANYGVSNEIVNATDITRKFEEQISTALVNQTKAKEFYTEKWQKGSGEIYWKTYTLVNIPTSVVEEIYKRFAKNQQEIMEEEMAKAKTEMAKEQYEKAMQAFEDAEKRGLGQPKQ